VGAGVSLPADSHVHTEWSWDAQHGSMQRSCAQAVELGLPSVAFTEHVDPTVWTVDSEALSRLPADHPVAVSATPPATCMHRRSTRTDTSMRWTGAGSGFPTYAS
jgi:hypothetical protein